MTTVQSIVLGILQGLGEFLPISSSGHLIVVPWLLGWPDHPLAFDVALHGGTLAAVLYAFGSDWIAMGRDLVSGLRRGRPFGQPGGRLLGLLALASIPGAVAGVLLDDWAETVFRSPVLVAVTMAALGTVLWIADRHAGGRTAGGVSLRDALLIGCAQAAALVPGVSRSGATISASLLLGYKREEAARFSFLLATPITAGALARKLPELGGTAEWGTVILGMVAAGVVGFASIRLLLGYVRTRDYLPFVIYRLIFALAVGAIWWLRG